MIALFKRCWRCSQDHVQTNSQAYATGGTAALMVVTLDAIKDTIGQTMPGYANAFVIATLIFAKSKTARDFIL